MSIAAGMVGALVMPHNIFLHSALVQSREIDLTSTSAKKEAIMYNAIESALSLSVTVIINLSLMAVFASGFHGQSDLGITEVGLGSAGQCATPPPLSLSVAFLLLRYPDALRAVCSINPPRPLSSFLQLPLSSDRDLL